MKRDLEAGRAAFARQQWRTAFTRLSAADARTPLGIEPLEELAVAAYLIGYDIDLLERLHNECARAGDNQRAVRIAFWIVVDLLTKGEWARGNGWLARARRLADTLPIDGAERGLLLVLDSRIQLAAKDSESALAIAQRVVSLAAPCKDRTLDAFSRLALAQALTVRGEWNQASLLLDEIMVAATTGDVPPIAAGILYCAVVAACHKLYDFPRAREWTGAFTRWCGTQPDLVPFRGQCLVHRVEIMRFGGDWEQALHQARETCDWLADVATANHPASERAPRSFKFPAGAAYYELGEIHRLRGEHTEAESAYRKASEHGESPEPGLALVRLAQGKTKVAESAIRRALEPSTGSMPNARVLAAAVEVFIASDDLAAAHRACDALSNLGGATDTPVLRAMIAQCRGQVLLAQGDVEDARRELRVAWTTWQELDAPYEAARVRVLLSRAYRQRDDADAAALEVDAARRVFSRLGAKHDLQQLDQATSAERPADDTLTPRERQVISMVAAGSTNRAIAVALAISERTVDRHVSNILVKLGVPSRAAATAFAYEHGLVGEKARTG